MSTLSELRRSLREHLALSDHSGAGGICFADGPCPVGDWRQADEVILTLLSELDKCEATNKNPMSAQPSADDSLINTKHHGSSEEGK